METTKLIGKGAFSKVYATKDEDICIVKTVDPCKLALAENIFFEEHSMFPKYTFVSSKDSYRTIEYANGKNYTLLTCKHYPKVRSLKNTLYKSHYELYKFLRELASSLLWVNINHKDSYKFYDDYLTDLESKLNAAPKKFRPICEEIWERVNDLRNYGTFIQIEISPRNVAVDGKRLILLDIFFCGETLVKART